MTDLTVFFDPSLEPVFFWSNDKNAPHGCFSNFKRMCDTLTPGVDAVMFYAPVGTAFYSSEQYMMRAKADLFGDSATAAKIMKAFKGSEIRKLGREVANYDDARWTATVRDVVADGCLLKFAQQPAFRAALLATGERQLVEASPYDGRWGIKMDAETARQTPREHWTGTNWLGQVLMWVRAVLRNTDPSVVIARPW